MATRLPRSLRPVANATGMSSRSPKVLARITPTCLNSASYMLSAPAIALIKGLAERKRHKTLVFPSPRDDKVLSDMALTSFLRRVKALSDTPGRVATAHGFRSSFRDWASEHGYARDLAERALAHTVANQVEAAYHRTDLLEQRRPMMEAWAQHLCSPQHRFPTKGTQVVERDSVDKSGEADESGCAS